MVTTTEIAAPASCQPVVYWEERARRFATEGDGLAAVCSYGMPAFYNRVIHTCQRLALEPWLRVTGIDLSATMIAQAERRAAAQGVAERCRFLVQDLAVLDAGQKFDLVLGVTVLQHILEPQALRAATHRMVAHLAEGGTLILLEAAPNRAVENCDSSIFRARQRSAYLRLFADCGLRVRAITGVDPAPFKTWLLPYLPRLPQRVRTAALAVVTALSIPIDVLFGRIAVEHSWHAVFVLERARGPYEC